MKNYQKYSLSSILNTYQLSPQVYDTIIHEIKSPLQQQSIQLTNDHSIQGVKVPKRPNIPPLPPSPCAQFNQNFSRTHQSYELQLQKSPINKKQVNDDNLLESMVSPLDYQKCNNDEQEKPYLQFCGGFCSHILKSEKEIEVVVPEQGQSVKKQRNFKRRPIFKEFNFKQYTQPRKSVQDAILALHEQQEDALAIFLTFLSSLESELVIIDRQRKELHQNIDGIYQKLSSETQYAPEVSILADSHQRILRRLKSRNTGQVVAKIMKKSVNQNGGIAQKKLQTLFGSLSKIEEIIVDYLRKENALQSLNRVHSYLTHNFDSQRTLVKQLQRLFETLNISIFIDGLSLIWKDCEDRRLTKEQFIEGVSLNDCIVRSPNEFESELVSKGFQRNS